MSGVALLSPAAGEAVLWAHAASTALMTGLVLFVAVVHYPLFARVSPGDPTGFIRYEVEHASRTSFVVGPLMLVEAATAIGILMLRPAGVPGWMAVLSVVLLAVVWGVTFLGAVPMHQRLALGFDASAHRVLLIWNWVRTAAWCGRAVLAFAMVRCGLLVGA